jgi:hypothetical protein
MNGDATMKADESDVEGSYDGALARAMLYSKQDSQAALSETSRRRVSRTRSREENAMSSTRSESSSRHHSREWRGRPSSAPKPRPAPRPAADRSTQELQHSPPAKAAAATNAHNNGPALTFAKLTELTLSLQHTASSQGALIKTQAALIDELQTNLASLSVRVDAATSSSSEAPLSNYTSNAKLESLQIDNSEGWGTSKLPPRNEKTSAGAPPRSVPSSGGDADDPTELQALGESMWDSPIVLGSRECGHAGSAFTWMLVLGNAGARVRPSACSSSPLTHTLLAAHTHILSL